jgi:hypothetical protein
MNLDAGEMGAIVVGLLVGYWAIGTIMQWLRPGTGQQAKTESAAPQAETVEACQVSNGSPSSPPADHTPSETIRR